MWDGGVNHLDVQYIAPITSEVEMDETLENVVTKLNNNKEYQELFQKAFGTKKITGQLTLKAISQFVVSLTTSNSKYDKVIRKEEKFTEMEQKGYSLFKQHCASCHKEPLFSSNDFKNNGLPIDTTLNDFAGSHVIVKWAGGRADETILQAAAELAAYYSANRESGRVEVDHAARRDVRKIKGAGPGMVTYRNEHTIRVASRSEQELRKLGLLE